MSGNLRIGIAGLGTVGATVVRLLAELNGLHGAAKPLEVRAVSARTKGRNRGIDLATYEWYDDPVGLAASRDIDVFVELIGGSDGVALAAVERALGEGKHVVSANKALLAVHGVSLARLAEKHGRSLNFEAAVAGAVPVIKTLREALAGNRIERIYGILNGTCNFILTNMEATQRSFDAVLADAQEKGYAEADPAFDIGGIDAAHKLSILASLAFGTQVNFRDVYVEGIQEVTAQDIAFANELGYRIKLLGLAGRTEIGIEQRVHPCFVDQDKAIAAVDDVTNAVVIESNYAGRVVLEGPGAGAEPTASAVIADLVDIAKGHRQFVFTRPATELEHADKSPMDDHTGAYYLRLTALDRPGVMATVSEYLAHEGVSIETIIQRGAESGSSVPIVLVTHECRESDIKRAIKGIDAHQAIIQPSRMIRIETLQ